jgi:hypothetical protein
MSSYGEMKHYLLSEPVRTREDGELKLGWKLTVRAESRAYTDPYKNWNGQIGKLGG